MPSGSCTRLANSVPFNCSGPCEFVTSSDRVRPRSAINDRGTNTCERSNVSVSSVSGRGANQPLPADTRALQELAWPARASSESLGEQIVPYTLDQSHRPFTVPESAAIGVKVSWANSPGVEYVAS